MSDEPFSYRRREILDYLPTGWLLADRDDHGQWNERKGRWEVTVVDGAELPWQLEIPAKAARKHGRIGALQRAVDRLYRGALG